MEEIKVNREFKSSIFISLFGAENNKKNLLDLYNALANTNYTNVNDLTLTTIDDVLYMDVKNDVSFIIESEMNLYEHQSTFNPNMPLRGLIYFSHLYQSFIEKNGVSIFGSTLIKIPTPQYIVFYNGIKKKVADKSILKLSDAFMNKEKGKGFEWSATMLNINIGHNKALFDKCRMLWEYSVFVDTTRKYIKKAKDTLSGVHKAVDECIKNDILKDFLKEKQSEVIAMCLFSFDKKKYEDTIRNEGERKGERKGKIETLVGLVKDKILSLQEAAARMGMTVEKFEKEAKNLALY